MSIAQAQGSPQTVSTLKTRKRILSGMRPTGPLHLGHLTGVLQNWVGLQNDYECFFMVADWHALTSEYGDSSKLPLYTRETALDWLAAGIDPARSVVFVQSEVKQHAELALLLGMFAPLPWLERVPTFKDQQEQIKNKDLNTYGFLGYPVLQTADILLYKGDVVPVGEDQVAHLEVSRELTRRVHFLLNREIFPEPQPLLSRTPKLLGIDGRKMSKSYDNAINLADPAEVVETKVRQMVTDPARVRRNDPGTPEKCSVFGYHEVFTQPRRDEIAQACRTAGIGCIECKKILAKSVNDLLGPIRERKAEFQKQGVIENVLEEGARKARETAEATMREMRSAMSLPNPDPNQG